MHWWSSIPWLRLLPPVLMVVTSLVKEFLPKERKVFKYVLIPLLVLFFLATVVIIVQDHQSSLDSKSREEAASLKTQADLDSLKYLYGPIAEFAKGRYPNLSDKNAILQLTARIDTIERAIQPVPLVTRLRGLLDEIDPRIIPALKRGTTHFKGDIPDPQYTHLIALTKENGSKEYIQIVPSAGGIGFGFTPSGESVISHSTEFILTPKLLQEP